MVATSELLHDQLEAITSDTLVVIVSQPCASGEMLGLYRSISKDITVLAATNESESELAQRGNEVMLLAPYANIVPVQATADDILQKKDVVADTFRPASKVTSIKY